MSQSHSLIALKIDGKDVQIAEGATILEAALQVGIKIPTLCWLQKVSPTGACRICVVEVAGAAKTMTACNTRATAGMEVTTQSERLAAIRRQVVELLLVNHPLDCPVCDAGGECDLQDICYSQDVTRQPFAAEDVNAPVINGWPLIQQVPNRCILCEKCVKVCHETIGASSLFISEKGDRAFIDKDLGKCEFCGNCVQVCPTGTMISKPFKFKARPWELRKTRSVCIQCGSHCQVDLHSKQGQVLRVTAEDGATLNNGNLCFGGFFGHDYLNAAERLRTPLLKGTAGQQPASWDAALTVVADGFKRLSAGHGGAAVAGLVGTQLTNEEGYLFQKLFRTALGSDNLDTAARFDLLPALGVLKEQLQLKGASKPLEQLGAARTILVFGADPAAEAPAADWQLQQAHRRRDARLIFAGTRRTKLATQAETFLQFRPGSEGLLAGALAKLVAARKGKPAVLANPAELEGFLAGIDVAAACAATGVSPALVEEAAAYLAEGDGVAVVFGQELCGAANAAGALAALANLALVSGALGEHGGGVYPLAARGNALGLLEAGVAAELLPGLQDYVQARGQFAAAWHAELPAPGAAAQAILAGIEAGTVRALWLVGVNPLVALPESGRWRQALAKLELLVVQDILASELTALADVVLPGAAPAEKDGTVTALDQRVSLLRKAVDPPGEARPDLTIFAELFVRLSGKPSASASALRREWQELTGQASPCCTADGERDFCACPVTISTGGLKAANPPVAPGVAGELLLQVGAHPYHFGGTSSVSAAANELAPRGELLVSPADAQRLGVVTGATLKLTGPAGSASGPVRVSDQLPVGVIFAPHYCPQLNIQQIMPAGANCVAVTAVKV